MDPGGEILSIHQTCDQEPSFLFVRYSSSFSPFKLELKTHSPLLYTDLSFLSSLFLQLITNNVCVCVCVCVCVFTLFILRISFSSFYSLKRLRTPGSVCQYAQGVLLAAWLTAGHSARGLPVGTVKTGLCDSERLDSKDWIV